MGGEEGAPFRGRGRGRGFRGGFRGGFSRGRGGFRGGRGMLSVCFYEKYFYLLWRGAEV